MLNQKIRFGAVHAALKKHQTRRNIWILNTQKAILLD